MMNERVQQTLECSRMLAYRWHDYLPDLELTWNPLDENSTVMAVNTFLDTIIPGWRGVAYAI